MIQLQGFPFPEDAPEMGACVRLERPEPGLVVLVLDPPHRSLAVLDAPLLRDLDMALNEVEREPRLRGLVLAGRKPDQFAAGADIHAIQGITEAAAVEQVVAEVHRLFNRIQDLPATTVAAVGGPVPGGAYELALCCDWIVASDDSRTRIGLPEVMLGILPGWGGSHRLPRRVGVPLALDAILTGRLLPPVPAKKRGMVDRLTRPEYLQRVAADVAMGRERLRRRKRGWKRLLVDGNPALQAFIARQARKTVMARTRGQYPAPLEALRIVAKACSTGRQRAVEKEAAAVGRLATGPVCKNLIAIFLSSEEVKKAGRGSDSHRPRRFERGAVVGAGVMGGAVASLMAERGIATRLADLAPEALDRAVIQHRTDVERSARRRRTPRHEVEAACDRLEASRGLVGLGRAQVVVEAVAEDLEVKRKVFGDLCSQVPADCVLATNTSSLSVDAIAEGLPGPERFVGMHFFNPVKRMPLVEVVQGAQTGERAVVETAALALRLGKTPVVVRDVPGFLVNRLLSPYLDEGVRLFLEGADPGKVDRVMLKFGLPMGPLTLLDEVGLDIASHVAEHLHQAYGARMTPSDGIGRLMKPDRLGKKTGHGFYLHPRGGGRKKARPALAADLPGFQSGESARGLSDQELTDRMVLCMVNEAARCLEEGVVASAAELDLATVYGTGFAPFRGGLLRYADSRGLAEVAERLQVIAQSPEVAARTGGKEKFLPATLLKELADSGGRFHG